MNGSLGKLVSLLMGPALLAGAGCSTDDPSIGTHIGNPSELRFRMSDGDASSPPSFVDDQGVSYELFEARIAVGRVELELPEDTSCVDLGSAPGAGCSGDDRELIVQGPLVVDLLEQTTLPAIGAVPVPRLRYERVELRLDAVDETDELVSSDDPLLDNSLYFRARFTREGRPAELRVALRFGETLRIDDGGVALMDGDDVLNILFDPARLLAGAPIAECIDRGDLAFDGDVLVIDEDVSCSNLENLVKDNVREAYSIATSPL